MHARTEDGNPGGRAGDGSSGTGRGGTGRDGTGGGRDGQSPGGESPGSYKQVLEPAEIRRVLTRIAHEILERTHGADEIVLLGIPTRGVPLAQRLAERATEFEGRPFPGARSTSPCTGTT